MKGSILDMEVFLPRFRWRPYYQRKAGISRCENDLLGMHSGVEETTFRPRYWDWHLPATRVQSSEETLYARIGAKQFGCTAINQSIISLMTPPVIKIEVWIAVIYGLIFLGHVGSMVKTSDRNFQVIINDRLEKDLLKTDASPSIVTVLQRNTNAYLVLTQ